MDYYIEIVDFPQNEMYYVRDTIKINYKLTDTDIDSVCLFINDSITQTQVIPDSLFWTVFDSIGSYSFVLKAFFSNKYSASSNMKYIQISSLNNPQIKLHCTRIDGDLNYFIGERLEITVKPKWEWVNMGIFRQATLFLNDIELGEISNQPYRFETDIITNIENQVTIELIDTADHVYIINKVLMVPVNTPPEIVFGFKIFNNIWSGYYFSTDRIIFSTSGKDNVEVSYLNYYIDDNFIGSDTLRDDYFMHCEHEIDTIAIGKHSCFCVAYDDRGDSTISDKLDFVVYKTYSLTEEFIDMSIYKEKDITYSLSLSKLYRIDNCNELIDATYTLPLPNPIGLFMSEISKLLYIGFDNGSIYYFNDESRTFNVVVEQAVSNLSDFEIDVDLKVAITIANQEIKIIDLTSNEVYESGLTLDNESTLVLDVENNLILAGGNPGSSSSDIFKLTYDSNSVGILQEENLGGYADKIILDPLNSKFLILPNPMVYNIGYNSYTIADFTLSGTYSGIKLRHGCYGNVESKFFTSDDFNNLVYVYDKADYLLIDEYYIPNKSYFRFNKIISSSDDSKLIISTLHVFDDDMKLIFLRLEN